MAYNFLAADRDQLLLLPPSLAEWLPEDHLAYFIIDAVEEMDLDAFYAEYRADGWGGAAHDPKVMVALVLYAYCLGVRSSRQIERACHVDVAFRVIAANTGPDHTTIARFRSRHEGSLKTIFAAALALCARAGMATVGLVVLDGTKIAAAAASSANRSAAHIAAQVEAMLAEAAAADAAEDAEFGPSRGDESPAALRGRTERRRRFAEAKARLDAEQAARCADYEAAMAARAAEEARRGQKIKGRKPKPPRPRPDAKANTTDADSRQQRSFHGYLQGYNAQAVANENQVILAAEVTNDQNDFGRLHPMIAATKESLAAAGITEPAGVLLADAGYCTEDNLADLGPADPDCYIATRNRRFGTSPTPGRSPDLEHTAAMDTKLSSLTAQGLYRRRAQIIEPIFGQIKETRGFRRFKRRGQSAVDSEWKLETACHNLLKLYRRVLVDASVAPYSRLAVRA